MLTLLASFCSFSAIGSAGETSIERAAETANISLFGEELLAANIEPVLEHAAQLPPKERYDYLLDWVLAENRIRFEARLISTDQTGSVPASGAVLFPQAPPESFVNRLQSPLLFLLATAQALNQLDTLELKLNQHCETWSEQQYDRIAIQTLLSLLNEKEERGIALLEQFVDQRTNSPNLESLWVDITLMACGAVNESTSNLVFEHLFRQRERINKKLVKWTVPGQQLPFETMFLAILGELDHRRLTSESVKLADWIPVRHDRPESLVRMIPASNWQYDGEQVRHIAGQGHDRLYFCSPLQGNYQIECDVQAPNYRDSGLQVAGFWSCISRNLFRYGDPTRYRGTDEIKPKLTALDDWVKVQVRVENDQAKVWWNGRLLHEYQLRDKTDPWLVFLAYTGTLEAVRNVRITGEPVVPKTIQIPADLRTGCWYNYYELDPYFKSSWINELIEGQPDEIRSPHQVELIGTGQERLLRYHRPMLEPGMIQYEFYYEPETQMVHPALGNTAFLLSPEGVSEHRLTGMIGNEEIWDSLNENHIKGDQTSSALPLRAQDWNQLQLQHDGVHLHVILNGETVYRRELSLNADSFFGLFHYCDRSAVRVRSISWTGDWKTTLPVVTEQQLAWSPHECLHDVDSLQEVIHFDFRTQPIDEARMTVQSKDRGKLIQMVPGQGVQLSSPHQEAWTASTIQLNEPVYGDFDITLTFEGLKMDYGETGTIGAELWILDESGIRIGCSRIDRGVDQINASNGIAIPLPNNKTHYGGTKISDETTAGTFRLVRTGQRVHALIAHENSDWFSYIGSQELPSEVSPIQVQIRVQSTRFGMVNVLFHDLTIRSNSNALVQSLDPRFMALKGYTSRFTNSLAFQFVPDTMLSLQSNPDKGEFAWKFNPAIRGDFDLELPISDSMLGDVSGSIPPCRLQLVADQDLVEVAISRNPAGKIEVLASKSSGAAAAPQKFAETTLEQLTGLRLIRIQKTLFLAVAEDGFYHILDRTRIEGDSFAGIQFTEQARPETDPNGFWKSLVLKSDQRVE
ncbi:MAG: DUF1583 domain-containing protein [Planctomycetaceae bacterium]|nr:DUF1583 domain-containing protein [Planctomycetaceae bacterium]